MRLVLVIFIEYGYMIFIVFSISFFRQFTAHITHGIPYRKPANKDNCEEDKENVFGMYADRIGVDNEVTSLVAKLNKPISLLQPA